MDTKQRRADNDDSKLIELRAQMAQFAYQRAQREAEEQGGEVIFEAEDIERIMAQVGFPAVQIPAPRTRSWAWWVPVPAVAVAIAFVAMMLYRQANPPGSNDIAAPIIALAPTAEVQAGPAASFEGGLIQAPEQIAAVDATLPVPTFELAPVAEPVQTAPAAEPSKRVANAEVRADSVPPAPAAETTTAQAAAPVPSDVREQIEDQLGTTFEDEQAPVAAAKPTEIEKSIDELLDDGAGDLKMKKKEDKAPTRTAIDRSEVKKAIATVRRRILNCATRAQVNGTTILKFTVAPSGKLSSAAVKGQLAGTEFATCAEAAAHKMSFEPYDGAPTSFTIPVPLDL